MDLLRDNELIYGRLLPVDEPHLIGRYFEQGKRVPLYLVGKSPVLPWELGLTPELFRGRMIDMLRNEVRFTTPEDGVPADLVPMRSGAGAFGSALQAHAPA